MPFSLRSVMKFTSVAVFSQAALGDVLYINEPPGLPASCPKPQISCRNTTAVPNSCCFNTPGGQLLMTQFWDTKPSTGPADSWTIHGLWPDLCNGDYEKNCDDTRKYTGIGDAIKAAGKTELLSFMKTYWKDYKGNDEAFWQYEWAKHGTCISTLKPSCYTGYVLKEELVDFFQIAVNLFRTLNSYKFLADAGILPSKSKTYTSAEIQKVLTAAHGFPVTIGCKNGEFNEIWYHFNVKGSLQTGTFIPTEPDGVKSTCPASGIKYFPKSGAPAPTVPVDTKPVTNPTTTTSTTTTPSGISGKGHLNVIVSSTQKGCIISNGAWYTVGECATFTAKPSGSGFVLSSSRGKCGIDNRAITCGSSVSSTVFTASGKYLAAGDSTAFYAKAIPSGFDQEKIYTSAEEIKLAIAWEKI